MKKMSLILGLIISVVVTSNAQVITGQHGNYKSQPLTNISLLNNKNFTPNNQSIGISGSINIGGGKVKIKIAPSKNQDEKYLLPPIIPANTHFSR